MMLIRAAASHLPKFVEVHLCTIERVFSGRSKAMDKDGLYSALKRHIDALRFLGVIPGDDPKSLNPIATQARGTSNTVVIRIEGKAATNDDRISDAVPCNPNPKFRRFCVSADQLPDNPSPIALTADEFVRLAKRSRYSARLRPRAR